MPPLFPDMHVDLEHYIASIDGETDEPPDMPDTQAILLKLAALKAAAESQLEFVFFDGLQDAVVHADMLEFGLFLDMIAAWLEDA